ncbi:MAG: hypothetical protein JWQ10_107 [Herbaspirillum sp.]|nr:hypothetical protein [Herbaspirillum sp.]
MTTPIIEKRLIAAALWLLFAFWVIFKCFLLWNASGPAVLGDEIIYKLFAQRIMEFKPYVVSKYFDYKFGADPHFPPGYPFFLAIVGWVTNTNQIHAMKIANIVAATLVMFPVYGIAKEISSKPAALGAAIVAGAVPYQFFFPVAVMSENISVTLTVAAFYLALRSGKNEKTNAIIFGLCLAANYLTKFSFLPVAPFPVLIFALRQLALTDPRLPLLSRTMLSIRPLIIAFIAFSTLMSVWIAYAVYSGLQIDYALGFLPELVGLENAFVKSPYILFVYSILQLAATICAILPILFPAMLIFFIRDPDSSLANGQGARYRSVMFWFVLVMGMFFAHYIWSFNYYFAALNHIANVDVTNLQQSVGERYTMFNFCLLLPIAFAAVNNLLTNKRSTFFYVKFIVLGVLSVVMAYFSHQVLFNQTPWPIAGYITFSWVMAPNIAYGLIGPNLTYIAAAVFIGLAFVAVLPWILPCKLISKEKINTAVLIIFAVAVSGLTSVEGIKTKQLVWDNPAIQSVAALGGSLSTMIGHDHIQDDRIFITVSKNAADEIAKRTTQPFEEWYWSEILSFWTGKFITVVSSKSPLVTDSCLYSLSIDNAGGTNFIFKKIK